MTERLRIILDNQHDTATLSATSEALPVSFTQRSGRSYAWRSTDLGQQTITTQLVAPSYIDAVVIYGHNLSGVATVRIEHRLNGQRVARTSWQYIADIIPLGEWEAGVDAWGQQDLSDLPIQQYVVWTEALLCDEYVIEIRDANNPDGYMQIGRIFSGTTFTPELNPVYGLTLEWQDFGEFQRTESGSLRTIGEGMARRLTLDLRHISKSGTESAGAELLKASRRRDVYINVYPEKGGMLENEHAFIARRANSYQHSHSAYNQWEIPLEYEEV